jgi:hypothetical protein
LFGFGIRFEEESNLVFETKGQAVNNTSIAASIISGRSPNRTGTRVIVELDSDEARSNDGPSSETEESEPQKEKTQQLFISEITELEKAIHDTISNLFKMSMAIRKPTPRGRYEVSASKEPIPDKFDISHVWERYPHARSTPWLIERLGKAITRRREYLRYRQQHRINLARLEDIDSSVDEAVRHETATKVTPSQRSSAYASTHATTLVQAAMVVNFDAESEPDTSGVSVTSYATSTSGDTEQRIRVPDPPNTDSFGTIMYGEEFECPYCCTIQIIRDRQQWK